MTYEQYWNEDCLLTKYYRKANDLKREKRNQELWLQGLYIYEALCDVSPVLHAFAKNGTKPLPYVEEPFALSEKESEKHKECKKKTDRKRAKAVFEAWASTLDLPQRGVDESGR